MIKVNVNGKVRELDVDPEMPLLWALRDVLALTGTKYGCGQAQCGACSVHLDGQVVRSCVTPMRRAAGREVGVKHRSTVARIRAMLRRRNSWTFWDKPRDHDIHARRSRFRAWARMGGASFFGLRSYEPTTFCHCKHGCRRFFIPRWKSRSVHK